MRLFLAALATVIGFAPAAGQLTAQTREHAEILTAVHGFHRALAAGDSAAALQLLHTDVVIHETGRSETLSDYRGGHLRADIAFATATQRSITDETVEVWDDTALYTATSRTTGRWRDRDVDSTGAETILLVRTPDGWRIRHIHWSSRG